MILCITEKPSVAKDIAEILGANIRRDGYYEGTNCPYKVTWTFGHLCCLKEPADYTEAWRRWSLVHLPMIPPKFGIRVIPKDQGIARQFQAIENLIKQADEVINCGDAGQEGELIQRWVMQKAGIKCPVKRLWISSLTDDAIRAGFQDLKPESDYQNLYLAGLARAIGDWLLGMNATRLYTLKYAPGNLLSIGRVQTPTLALIVQRHREIANFKPEDYWELRTLYREVWFQASGVKFKSEAEGQKVIDRIAAKPFCVTDVTEKKGKEAPPRLFDLTSLQVECNKKWGWSADETLRLIQSLYEKKVTTYPRVDTTYLPEDVYKKVPQILRDMTPYANITAPLLSLSHLPKSKKVFDNSKVTDHHAIIPTGQSPTVLAGPERQLYHLIAVRFIAAFYPDCSFTTTTVLAKAGDIDFKVTGKVINDPGWRVLYNSEPKNDAEKDEDNILPPFVKGESGPHAPALVKKTTQPPKYYTEGTLLRAMEGAGKTVDDEELREAMKENGIGRPSTRAAIIQILLKRRYIYHERKNLMASQAGIELIDTINEELLKSAKLTGLWENKLRRIERGQYSATDFIAELKAMVTQIVDNVIRDTEHARINIENKEQPASTPSEPEKKKAKAKAKDPNAPKRQRKKKAVDSLEQIKCPLCGKGHILRGRTAYGCSQYASGCTWRLDFTAYPPTLTPQEIYDMLYSK